MIITIRGRYTFTPSCRGPTGIRRVNPEYEKRIPPGVPCIGHDYEHIQGKCIHKTGKMEYKMRIGSLIPRIPHV